MRSAQSPSADRFAEGDVEIAGETPVDGRLGHGFLGDEVVAFLRIQDCDLLIALKHQELPPSGPVVGSRNRLHPLELEAVAGGLVHVTGGHAHVLLAAEVGHHGGADDEHGDAQMGQQHAVVAAPAACPGPRRWS